MKAIKSLVKSLKIIMNVHKQIFILFSSKQMYLKKLYFKVYFGTSATKVLYYKAE